ncbi:MAG TPA: glycosyltransferase family 2 protein [Burkholderiaceae bacterium]|nr:glycosyltransferase family 2 protein [Burkholderiaceae bacterium]
MQANEVRDTVAPSPATAVPWIQTRPMWTERAPLPPRELAVIVPTFNESANVEELVRRLDVALEGVAWEVVFVDDDSPDDTAAAVRAISQRDARVRVVQRLGRRGLSSACVEGVLATSAPYVAVMDGDLQHDEAILPAMLAALREGEVDVAVGSRYVDGGGIGEWDGTRASISRWATKVSRAIVPPDLADPMSGFFMIRRDAFMERVRRLSSLGFKILVDLFASGERPLRFVEIPFRFRTRHAGESKLDGHVAWDYGMLLLDKLVGRWIPVRFLSFALIGGLGVGVHMAVLAALYGTGSTGFRAGQATATGVAMVFNFLVNNQLTYRDRRLRGAAMLRGLLSFSLVCSVGAIANVGIAEYLFVHRQGWVPAALGGILVGAVWNFATSSFYTWGKRG